MINTEKARSEPIIAPVLVEWRKVFHHRISVFSGVAFNVIRNKGLNGVCDFMVSTSPKQILITAPIIHIVEAKTENIKSGIPHCLAMMYDAQEFHKQKNIVTPVVYGVVTTGSAWKFRQLQEHVATVDSMEYFIDNVGKIMGILLYMTTQEKA